MGMGMGVGVWAAFERDVAMWVSGAHAQRAPLCAPAHRAPVYAQVQVRDAFTRTFVYFQSKFTTAWRRLRSHREGAAPAGWLPCTSKKHKQNKPLALDW